MDDKKQSKDTVIESQNNPTNQSQAVPSQKITFGNKTKMIVISLVVLIVIIAVGLISLNMSVKKTQTVATEGLIPIQRSYFKDLSNRPVNELFPKALDNLSANSIFEKELTGGPEYKILPLDQEYISKLPIKAKVAEAYQAFYGNTASDDPHIELSFFKLASREDVNSLRQIQEEYISNNLPSGWVRTMIKVEDAGVETWAVNDMKTNDPKLDDIRILFPESRIFIQLRRFSSNPSQAAEQEQASAYINFIKSYNSTSFVDSQYLLTDKLEAERLSKQRKEFIQKGLQLLNQSK